jgi:hypothetical protein
VCTLHYTQFYDRNDLKKALREVYSPIIVASPGIIKDELGDLHGSLSAKQLPGIIHAHTRIMKMFPASMRFELK